MSTNRREFLTRAAGGAAAVALAGGPLVLSPSEALAQAANPLPPYLMQQIAGAAEELYIQAYIRDPSNTVAEGGTYGGPMPGLDQLTIGRLASYCQQLDGYASSQGVYGRSDPAVWLGSISPVWMGFAANQAQVALKKDFFSLVSLHQIASDVGFSLPNSANGAALQGAMATVIRSLQNVANGNYASLHGSGKGMLKYARFQTMTDGELFIGGGTLMGSGGVLLGAAGGPAVLTAPITSALAAAAAAIGWTGFGMIIVGAVVVIYVGYRYFSQKYGLGAGPWQHPDQNPGDPPYLHRLQSKPPFYPPWLPPTPAPNFQM